MTQHEMYKKTFQENTSNILTLEKPNTWVALNAKMSFILFEMCSVNASLKIRNLIVFIKNWFKFCIVTLSFNFRIFRQ